jgi:hypothetical protein
MRKMEFLQNFDILSFAVTNGGGSPLSYSVKCKDSGLFEIGRIKGAGSVGKVMLRK